MVNTMLIELIDSGVTGLLYEMERLHLIKILDRDKSVTVKLSEKYCGVWSKEDAADFNKHTQTTREEW